MKAVLDTNVLVSATLFGGIPEQVLASARSGRFESVTSLALLDEFEDVLVRKFHQDAAIAHALRNEVESSTTLVEPTEVVRITRDPDDDLLLAVAVAASVDAIVSGDADVLDVGSHRDIEILTPRAFLDRLDVTS